MDLERTAGRILRLTLILTAVGTAIYFVIGGWQGGCGFLLGGLISYLNFGWLKRTVDALGGAPGGKPPRTRTIVILGLRYLLLGGGAYAILKFSEISLNAALVGLFAPAAAVILEILIELIYART
jgi:hypothetical protein